MAIYEETFEDAKRIIEDNWNKNGSKPNLFAHVQIRFGEKYMIDYTETYIRPGIQVLEDLMHKVDDICDGIESEDNISSAIKLEEDITLHQAVIQEDLAKIRALICRGDNIQSIDNDGATPLHYAAHIAHASIARLLLENGAFVDAKNAKGQTPLHEVAGHLHREGDEATMVVLLDAGASLSAQDNQEATPLHAAAIGGHYEAAKLLLDRGADIQAHAQQLTPLHFSAYAGKPGVTKLLIERGADVFAEKNGMNPLYMAQQPSHSHESDKRAVVQMLEQAMARGKREARPTTSSQVTKSPSRVRSEQTATNTAEETLKKQRESLLEDHSLFSSGRRVSDGNLPKMQAEDPLAHKSIVDRGKETRATGQTHSNASTESEKSGHQRISSAKQTRKRSPNADSRYARKETLYLVSLLALAVGFFSGVMVTVYKSESTPAVGPSTGLAPQPQVPRPQAADPGTLSKIAALEKETRANPTNEKTWTELGNSYFDTDQHEKAIQAYRQALEINPDNANIWTDMGVMYRRSGKPIEAIRSFDKAIEVNPKHEVSRMNKGIVLLLDMNDLQGAIEAWEGLLQINPVAVAPNGQSIDRVVQQIKKQVKQQGLAN